MIIKNAYNEQNALSSELACYFSCYRLIPLNKLARNAMNINNLKNEKKMPVISGISGHNAGNAVLQSTVISHQYRND